MLNLFLVFSCHECALLAQSFATGNLNYKVSFRVFAVVAALSERVSLLDAKIKRLINSLSYHGLEAKLKLAKHLFYVNDVNQVGSIELDAVDVEMQAGNLSAVHRGEVRVLCCLLQRAISIGTF